MTLDQKRWVIGGLGLLFLLSLVAVQCLEVSRRQQETGWPPRVRQHAGRVAAVRGLPHASLARASSTTGPDPRTPRRASAASTVTRPTPRTPTRSTTTARRSPRSSRRATARAAIRPKAAEFAQSHHAQGRQHPGLARQLPRRDRRGIARGRSIRTRRRPAGAVQAVNGLAPRQLGLPAVPRLAWSAFQATDGGIDHDARPEARRGTASRPTSTPSAGSCATRAASRCSSSSTWPNTGIGRLNLDGSLGSCSACHSRHDFSRAPRAPAGELRQVPPRPRPSAEGDLRGVEARRRLPRSASAR